MGDASQGGHGGGGEILFVAHRVPYPPDRGDKIRSYHALRHLAGIAPVHLAALADDPRDLGHGPALEAWTASHCVLPRRLSRPRALLEGIMRREPLSVTLFREPRLGAYIRRIIATRPLAAIFVYSGNMAVHLPPLPSGVRFVMDFCDVDSAKFRAYGAEGNWPMAWLNRREGRLLAKWETKVAGRADASLFVSRAEADVFAGMAGVDAGRVAVLENGVDLDRFRPDPGLARPAGLADTGANIVFTGQMDYRPNVEAVTDFADHALPLIRQIHPDARFLIVGREPVEAVRALGQRPGITVTGEVADTRAWLAAADVVVAPLRIARGIQNKILEAMAMARPVVASAAAAEGIDAIDGEHLHVGRDATHEARLVIDLLSEPARAVALGQAARARVEARYGWDAAMAPLGHLLLG